MKKSIYLFSTTPNPHAIHVNSLFIKLLKPAIDFSKYDYLTITSKQVSEALKQYNKLEYLKKQALCVSLESAKSFRSIGGRVLDVGSGYGDTLEAKIKSYPKKTRWLYLRAKVVASDFVEKLKDAGYNIDEVILYESKCSKEIEQVKLSENAILIFTSPSGVNCFLKHHVINLKTQVVVIGTTTAKALPKGVKYHISPQNTIESCLELAKIL